MELKELKEMIDEDYQNSQTVRQRAADDLVFYWVTQWDDNLLQASDLSFRGEFNIVRKAGRRVMADLRMNPAQPDFQPIDDTREDAAELIDGLYRKDDRSNSSQEAYFNAQQEQVACGVGAWELYTEYESVRGRNKNQVIKRRPIHEANNVVFWDANSKLMDKSDANRVSILVPYSKEAYEELVEELTGEEDYKCFPSNFSFPQYSFTFPWTVSNFEWIFVGKTYVRTLEKDSIITLIDPITQELSEYYKSQVFDQIDDLVETGHIVVGEKEVERWKITLYISSGERILNGEEGEEIAGEHIPVVPVYGERAFVEGQEVWEGIVRLAKDPQRLRNFLLSYVADIASRSPRPKPLFFPEQVQGFEQMYQDNGADNQYPYYLIQRKTASGEELPAGPAGQMPEQQIPQAVLQLVQLTREAVSDVVGSDAMPKDFADIDLSGDALVQLNARIDQESVVYQENMKHAKRRDAEIYASMAARIYDAPREVFIVLPDGTRKREQIIKSAIDKETGEPVVLNDLRNAQFEVYAEIGPTYTSQKEKLRKELTMLIQSLPPDDPMRQLYMLKHAELMDGTDTKDIREYAKKQMILAGFKQPDTPEEEAMLQEAQGQQQPDAATLLAQAEMMKGQAAMMREQNNQMSTIGELEKKRADSAIDVFNAQTQRANVEINAFKVGEEVQIKKAELMGKQYAEMQKAMDRPIGKHSLHGKITERDIQDTMKANNMSREQVMRKLGESDMLSQTLRKQMNG